MKKKMGIAIATFVIGLSVLVAGVVFLVLHLTAAPEVRDGEYLVEKGKWALVDANCADCEAKVVWDFKEIGKGSLTTNAHENDYDFIWAIDGDKLAMETAWLYNLNDEFDYKLDKGAGTLTLTSKDGSSYTFRSTN